MNGAASLSTSLGLKGVSKGAGNGSEELAFAFTQEAWRASTERMV